MGESRHHAPVAAFSLPALVNLDTACTDIFLLGILRALASKTDAAERSYSARWRCAFGGSIPHQTTPACWLQRAGSLGGGRALMRTLRQGFPPQCLICVDRPRCKWLNLNFTSGRIPRVPRQARGCQGSPWSAIRPENISTQIKPAGSVQPAGFSFQHTKRMLPWNRNLGSGVSLIVAEFHTGKWTLWGAYWQDGARAIRIPAEMPHVRPNRSCRYVGRQIS